MHRKLLTTVVILMMSLELMAQYHTSYGHNRIQYRRFDWYYYSTNNFEVYYYPGGHEYAKQALDFLEDEFVKITDALGYAPYTKTKLFIYNSTHDLQQSNMGLRDGVFTIGGKTEFVKLQIELAYPGQASEFRNEIVYKLSSILINDMMYGGSLTEIFQNSYLLSIPDWFIVGAARYMAYGWSQDMDDYIRDYLGRNNVNKLVKIHEKDAALIGQSIWNYIAIKYGESSISNILNLTRIIRNEENSISSSLGMPIKMFLSDWQRFYENNNEELRTNYKSPDADQVVAAYRNKNVTLQHVKMSPDGQKVAYALHKDGRYRVEVVNLESGYRHKVVSGGFRTNDQEVDLHFPLLDWQDNDLLGAVIFKRGNLMLNTYHLGTGQKIQKTLKRFRNIEAFSFNNNGRLAVLSGDVDGQNDLFLISMRRNALKRITNDKFDDIDPKFIPGTSTLVFSSNRESDSIHVQEKNFNAIEDNYNLYVYNLDTTSHRFVKLTNTYSVDRKPIPKNHHEIYYLSDQKGITNLFLYNMEDSTFVQITDYEHELQDYDLAFNDVDKLAFMMIDDGRNKVFVNDAIDLKKKTFTPPSARQRMAQALYMAKRLPIKSPPAPKNELIKTTPTPKASDEDIDPDKLTFEDEQQQVDDSFIDTDNYVFEEEQRPIYKPESFFSNYRKFEKESMRVGPLDYEPRFNFNNVVTSFAIDPVRGFSTLMETELNDLLENHRLTAGVNTNMNLKSGNVFLEYQYLKYWMDFHLRFSRNVYLIDQYTRLMVNNPEIDINQKYALTRLEPGVAVPLTNAFRVEFSPFYTSTAFTNNHWAAIINDTTLGFAPNSQVDYVGARAALVFDNSIEIGYNLNQGTKALVEFESYAGIFDRNKNFSWLNVDVRHYQKIHKELTLAGRVFYGKSIGIAKQNYLLGGMQNWLFNTYENQGSADPLYMSTGFDNSRFLFTKYVTSLRGFDYNEVFGNNALLFNAELRLPLFRYLSNGPISSPFLRNFSMIYFYDIGAGWSGKSPFSEGGTAFTKTYVIPGSAFSAKISNFQNPWLSSHGWGMRFVLLGYFIKLDVASPIVDGRAGDKRYYVTLGLDF